MGRVNKYRKKTHKRIFSKKKKLNLRKFFLFKHRLKLIFSFIIIFCILPAVCIYVCSTLFLKVKNINVQGDQVCDSNDLIEKSGIKCGDNLLLIDANRIKSTLEKFIPEIESIDIKRCFPDKVLMNVKKANKVFELNSNDKYITTSSKGKILNISDNHDESLISLNGVGIKDFKLGSNIIFDNSSINNIILNLFEKICLYGISRVSGITFDNDSKIFINYDNGRIKINLGCFEDIDQKIKTVAEIINNRLKLDESGILDVSNNLTKNKTYFTPNCV